MHEMSLALEIRAICERELARQGGGRLTAVEVEVGALAGVDADSLSFCLDTVLREGFGDVRCDICVTPGLAVCLLCAMEFPVRRAPFECPQCGAPAQGASGGDALRVNALELE